MDLLSCPQVWPKWEQTYPHFPHISGSATGNRVCGFLYNVQKEGLNWEKNISSLSLFHDTRKGKHAIENKKPSPGFHVKVSACYDGFFVFIEMFVSRRWNFAKWPPMPPQGSGMDSISKFACLVWITCTCVPSCMLRPILQYTYNMLH